MNIAPIGIMPSFGRKLPKKDAEIKPAGIETQNKEIQYSTWGDNYAYPVEIIKTRPSDETKRNSDFDETPEQHYKRKICSPEWGAY